MASTRRWSVCLVAAGLALVTGCTGSSPAPAPTGVRSEAIGPPPASTSSTSSAPSPQVPSADRLALALLSADDLPSGFTQQPTSPVEGQVSSTDPRCAPFVAMFNARQVAGSQSHAGSRYAGGGLGPFVEEELDALADPAAVATALGGLRSAVAACPQATIDLAGLGQAPMTVEALVPASVGDSPVAYRITVALGGGLSFTQVTTGVRQTVVQLAFLGAEQAQVDEFARIAVDRVSTVLG